MLELGPIFAFGHTFFFARMDSHCRFMRLILAAPDSEMLSLQHEEPQQERSSYPKCLGQLVASHSVCWAQPCQYPPNPMEKHQDHRAIRICHPSASPSPIPPASCSLVQSSASQIKRIESLKCSGRVMEGKKTISIRGLACGMSLSAGGDKL